MTISDEQQQPDDLNRALSGRRFDRRGFMARVGALGLSAGVLEALAPALARAQDSTPEAATASGEVIRSMTRDEYYAKLHEAFAFEEPQNQGGQVILESDVRHRNRQWSSDRGLSDGLRHGLYLRTAGWHQPDRWADHPGAG